MQNAADGYRKFPRAFSTLFLFCVCLSATGRENSQGQARVWVLKEGEIAEYSPPNWALLNTIQVPKEFAMDPDRLQITHTGEMLFYMDPDIQFGNPGQHFPHDRIWIWNGRSASMLSQSLGAKTSGDTTVERRSRFSLSADGRRLFWLENEFRESRDREELSVLTRCRVWQTDLSGANPEPITEFSFPKCKCETGVCSETCPEASYWFPRAGIENFFFVNHWIPGQLESTFQSSVLFEKSGGKWISTKLAIAFEEVLDAARSGKIVVHAISDGGCCGWDNVGDDQTLVTMNGKKTRIFDERQKYGNANYDVSFYTVNAGLSPSGSTVAITLSSTAKPGDEIRLADEGKENPVELARIRKALDALPETEVISLANRTRPLVSLPRASFAGWLSDHEILVVENGVLTGYDVVSKMRRISGIKVSSPSVVFVQ